MNSDKKFINEITRQLCDPKNGLPPKFDPPPKTLGDWVKCLNYSMGWVNIGLDSAMVPYFRKLEIGEIISSEPFNMSIYKNGFASNEIYKFLKLDSLDCNYNVIMNYKSFKKFLSVITNEKSNEYKRMFIESLNKIFKKTDPYTFWIKLPINDITANYLFKNNLGEVIVKSVDSKYYLKSKNNESVKWDNDKMDTDIENTYDVENPKTNSDEDFDIKLQDDEPFNRLVMNNKTLLKLIQYACKLNNNTYNNINVFNLMGGDKKEEDFLSIFGKLKI